MSNIPQGVKEEHTPDDYPEIECKKDGCEDTFKATPKTSRREYCIKHRLEWLKEEFE